MDNKYGLGSTRVAHAHHDAVKATVETPLTCRFCGSQHMTLNTTMNDHFCKDCGQYQGDVPAGYSTGRSVDY